jgi:hypothetical protein
VLQILFVVCSSTHIRQCARSTEPDPAAQHGRLPAVVRRRRSRRERDDPRTTLPRTLPARRLVRRHRHLRGRGREGNGRRRLDRGRRREHDARQDERRLLADRRRRPRRRRGARRRRGEERVRVRVRARVAVVRRDVSRQVGAQAQAPEDARACGADHRRTEGRPDLDLRVLLLGLFGGGGGKGRSRPDEARVCLADEASANAARVNEQVKLPSAECRGPARPVYACAQGCDVDRARRRTARSERKGTAARSTCRVRDTPGRRKVRGESGRERVLERDELGRRKGGGERASEERDGVREGTAQGERVADGGGRDVRHFGYDG